MVTIEAGVPRALQGLALQQGQRAASDLPRGHQRLPAAIRHLGPWSGSKEGAVDQPRLPLCLLLAGQAFVLLHCDVSKLVLETARAPAK
jgi:hypothetical protein